MRSIGEKLLGADRALAVDRLAERVDHAAEHLFADRHRDDAAGALDDVAFLDLRELAEQHRADAFFFEVQRDAEHAVRELEHLAGHRVLDAVHARDAVADRDDAADFGDVDVDGVAADLLADDLGDFFSFDVHCYSGGPCRRACPSRPAHCASHPTYRCELSSSCAAAW